MSTVDEGALGRGESGRGERPGCTVSSGVLSGGRDGTAGGTDAVGDPFGVGEPCWSIPTPAGPRGSQRGMRNTVLGALLKCKSRACSRLSIGGWRWVIFNKPPGDSFARVGHKA